MKEKMKSKHPPRKKSDTTRRDRKLRIDEKQSYNRGEEDEKVRRS